MANDERRHQYFVSKATKRLKRDLKLILTDPIPAIDVAPNEDDILDWHFAIHGKNDTPYENGVYHVNKRIRFSLSDFHPEEWKPAYSVTAVLRGVYDFMHESTETIGSINSSVSARKQLALDSREYNLKNDTFCRLFPNMIQDDMGNDVDSVSQDESNQGNNEVDSSEIPGRIEMNITLKTYATTNPIPDLGTKVLQHGTTDTIDSHPSTPQNQDILETINPNSIPDPQKQEETRIINSPENEISNPPLNPETPKSEDGIRFTTIFPPPFKSDISSAIELQARQTPPINEPNSPTQDQANINIHIINEINEVLIPPERCNPNSILNPQNQEEARIINSPENEISRPPLNPETPESEDGIRFTTIFPPPFKSDIRSTIELHARQTPPINEDLIPLERCNSPSVNNVMPPMIDENIPADNVITIHTDTELNETLTNDTPTQPPVGIPIPPPEMPYNTVTLREDSNADLNSSLIATSSGSPIGIPVPQPSIKLPAQEPVRRARPFKISPISPIHSSLSRERNPNYNQLPAYETPPPYSPKQISNTSIQPNPLMNYAIVNSQYNNAVVIADSARVPNRKNPAKRPRSIPFMYRTQSRNLGDIEKGTLRQERSYELPEINHHEINCYYIALLVIVILSAIGLLYLFAQLKISLK
ncbi:hypothetical protein LOD99_3631 [Oopsacas minuta]|uniref:UBC core domain-containing protein n=1 Tax=Oopsacas minuta TaxID=111878 RepID=A0AAV7JX31_9METZ|nr:hypothetical protein LOD99_3631 [Oopsacas minuta]